VLNEETFNEQGLNKEFFLSSSLYRVLFLHWFRIFIIARLLQNFQRCVLWLQLYDASMFEKTLLTLKPLHQPAAVNLPYSKFCCFLSKLYFSK
jgi:hypothetical protein